MTERRVSDEAAMRALANPLKEFPIKVDDAGRKSKKIIGWANTIVVNPDNGNIITAYKTKAKYRRKYEKRKEETKWTKNKSGCSKK